MPRIVARLEDCMHHEFQTDNFFDSFIGVWKRVTTEPRRFFEEMPVSGGLQNPLLFMVVCLAICGLGFLLVGPRGLTLWIMVLGLLRAFVGSLVLMVVARQMFGGVGDYEATFRAVAYSSAPVAFLWIPFIRPLIGVYALFLVILGLERVHAFDAAKAALTVVLAAVVGAAVSWMLGWPQLWMVGHLYGRCA
jgi:hypothetical protein